MEIDVRGHRCVCEVSGSGPHLTLLHSVGLSTREGWREQIAQLSQSFTVLSYDFRGLGQSSAGDEPPGVATFARDLEMLLGILGIERTALMGVSLGGFVAQHVALARPDLVTALVLVSTTCRIFSGNEARRAERNRRIREEGMKIAADHQIESHFPPALLAARPDLAAWYKSHYVANDPERYIAIMEDLGRFDCCERLGDIICPALIIAGDQDATSVAGRRPLDSAEMLNRGIRNSQLVVIEGANHYPQLDHVTEFNNTVSAFLSAKLLTVQLPL